MKSRSPNTRRATSPYAAIASVGPLIAIAGTPLAANEPAISAAHPAEVVTSQRVDLVAQLERAREARRQICGGFGAESRTDQRRDAVAIGEREKSVPVDRSRGQLGNRRATRRGRRAASYQQLTLEVGEVHIDRAIGGGRGPLEVAALKSTMRGYAFLLMSC